MPPQEGGNGLSQFVFGVAGGDAGRGADEQYQPQQVALRQDGGGHIGDQLIGAVRNRDGLQKVLL